MTDFRKIKYYIISWHALEKKLQTLAKQITNHQINFDHIIAISRCGLPLGQMLSDYLNLPVSVVGIKSYTDFKTSKKPEIIEKLTISLKGKSILIVDGTADTGKTLLTAIGYLQSLYPTSITSATIFYKLHSIYKPDFFVEKTSKWIVMPYEMIEFGSAICKKLLSEKKTKKGIYSYLKKYSFTQKQFYFVWKNVKNKSNFDKAQYFKGNDLRDLIIQLTDKFIKQ